MTPPSSRSSCMKNGLTIENDRNSSPRAFIWSTLSSIGVSRMGIRVKTLSKFSPFLGSVCIGHGAREKQNVSDMSLMPLTQVCWQNSSEERTVFRNNFLCKNCFMWRSRGIFLIEGQSYDSNVDNNTFSYFWQLLSEDGSILSRNTVFKHFHCILCVKEVSV